MKKSLSFLLIILLLIFSSIAVYASWRILYADRFLLNKGPSQKNLITKIQFSGSVYTESDQRFSIQVPAGWFVKDYGSLNPKVIKFIAMDKASLPDVLPLSPSFRIIITVQDFMFDELLSIMGKNLENLEKKDLVINGKNATQIIYDSDMGDGKIYGIVFQTVGGIVTITGEDNTETRTIIGTVQIIK